MTGLGVPEGWGDLGLEDVAPPDELLPEKSRVPEPSALLQVLALVRVCRRDCDALDVRIRAERAWWEGDIDWQLPRERGAWTARLKAAEKRGHVEATGTREGYLTFRLTERGRLELAEYERTHPRVLRAD